MIFQINFQFEKSNLFKMIEEEKEEWRIIPIPGNDIYQASYLGQIRNKNTKRILKKPITEGGYEKVCLYLENGRKLHLVHRLIAFAFIPNPNNFPEVNHKDRNKTNNRVENLEWVTRSMNMKHCVETGKNHYKRAVWRRDPKREVTIFDSITEAAKLTGCNAGSISNCLSGKTKTAGGFEWGYVKEKIKEARKDIAFREIKDYPRYQIYNNGQIYTKKRNHYLKSSIIKGYYSIDLYNNNRRKFHYVHILVARHFCENPGNKPIVNHIDGDKLNNHYTNLEWTTQLENVRHAHSLGLNKKVSKRVYQYAKEDKDKRVVLRTFNNMRQVAESVKFKSKGTIFSIMTYISMACTGVQNTAYGYRWGYEEIIV